MNFNLIKNISIFILFIFLIISCENKQKNEVENIKKDRLLVDSLYTREWLRIDYGNERIEDVEIYITKNNDTFSNQFKPYIKKSTENYIYEFYDLKISESGKPKIYNGQITVHSKYDNLILDEKNRKTLEFYYCEQNSDSIRITEKLIEGSNKIEFQYENFYGKRLQGMIYLTVERDTIINDEKMMNMFMLQILVDNESITDNLFAKSLELDKKKKFNPEQLKLTIEKNYLEQSTVVKSK
ncbi:hypothetical protein MWU76_20450 [Gelidibacter sp. F2691]|nr:hypothetical protein [Gelidibacter sp. F2691]